MSMKFCWKIDVEFVNFVLLLIHTVIIIIVYYLSQSSFIIIVTITIHCIIVSQYYNYIP